MSPARRFMLAWFLSPGLLFQVLIQLTLLAVLMGAILPLFATPGGRVAFADWGEAPPTAYVYFISLPVLCSFYLRTLLANEGLALSRAHARWQVGVFMLILPLLAGLALAVLLILGIRPVQAGAIALAGVACGAWLGIAPLRTFLVMMAYTAGCRWLASASPQFAACWPVVQSGLACVAVGLLWRHLWFIAWEDLQPRPIVWTIRLNEWFDRHLSVGSRMVRAPARGLPGIGTAVGFKDQLSGSGIVLWLGTLLSVAIPLFFAARSAHGADEFLAASYLIVAFVALGSSVGWISAIEYPRSYLSGGAIRGFLAAERLRPWSNQRGAAALLLAICMPMLAHALSFALAILGGLSAAAPGLDPQAALALGLLIPFAAGCAVATGAAVMLLMLLPGPAGWVGLGSLFLVPLGILPACGIWGSACFPLLTGIVWAAALVLTPLAWHRLAACELP